MVTVLNDLRPGIVALKLDEEVTKDEFIKTIQKAAENCAKENIRLDLLLLIENLPEQFEKGAWIETFFSTFKKNTTGTRQRSLPAQKVLIGLKLWSLTSIRS